MGWYARHQANQPSNERIVQIAMSKGVFEASWRYRDDGLRKRCRNLAKQGYLKRVRGQAGIDWYEPTPLSADYARERQP